VERGFDGPYRAWYNGNKGLDAEKMSVVDMALSKPNEADIKASLNYLVEHIMKKGPYDGVLCFS
jgi:hypothetical protein